MITQKEAVLIVAFADAAWPDVPLRQDTMAIWLGHLTDPAHYFTFEDANEAMQYLLHTQSRRPTYADIIREARAQHKIRVDREQQSPTVRLEAAAYGQIEKMNPIDFITINEPSPT